METKTRSNDFPIAAAKLSLFLPIIVLPIDFIAYGMKKDFPMAGLISWCVVLLIASIGLICGIMALVKREPSDKIEYKKTSRISSIGIFVNAMIIMVFILETRIVGARFVVFKCAPTTVIVSRLN